MKRASGILAALVLLNATASAQDADIDFIKSAVGKAFVSSDYYASPDFKKLQVELQTIGFDGGSMDFHSFGKDVLKLSKAVAANGLPVDYIDVMISVPTIDKYGNSSTGDGGTITWAQAEIQKLNENAPQYLLFELAHEVSLNRFGVEMAHWYCEKWEMRDPRYCE